MMLIDISFVITSYNYEMFLEKCIYSCLDQSSSALNFEIIIVDDGSTDNTSSILKKIHYENVHIYFLKNQGVERASNFGFNKCSGKYVVRIDADDYLDKDFLKNIEPFLKINNHFFYFNYKQVDINGALLKKVKLPPFNKDEIFCRGDFLASGTIYPKTLIEKFGYYDVSYKNSGLENFDLILKLIKNNIKGLHINKYSFYYRRHTKNLSNLRKNDIIKHGKQIMRKYGSQYRTNEFHPYELELI